MAVVVVSPDRDERDGRIDGVEELRFLVSRAVMGHLQDIRAYGRGAEPGEQVLLLLSLRVAGQQHGPAADADAQDE
jgi:hypothetical protein